MSTTLRQRATRQLNKLKAALTSANDDSPVWTAAIASNVSSARDAAITSVKANISTIRSLIAVFPAIETQWLLLISNLSPEERVKEETVMLNYTQATDGLDETTEHAEAVVLRLQAMIPKLPPSSATLRNVRLPTTQLATFSGIPRDFPRFKQSFFATIHDNPDLAVITKLDYLLKSVAGPAAACLQGFDLVDSNYTLCWSRLEERFGDPQLIVQDIYQSLYGLRCASESIADGRRFADEVETVLLQMESMKIDVTNLSIRMAIETKTPQWIRKHLFPLQMESTWDLAQLRTALQKIVATAERQAAHFPSSPFEQVTTMPVQFNDTERVSIKRKPAAQRSNHSGRPAANPSTNLSEEHACVFHQSGPKSHTSDSCKAYATPEARKLRLQELKNCCYRCLRIGHMSRSCPSQTKCAKCGRTSHHTLLCLGERAATTTSLPVTEAAAQSVELITAATTTESSAPPATRQALLMSKEVEITNLSTGQRVKALVFFDSGSQVSFMSTKLAASLGLSGAPSSSMDVNIFNGMTTVDYAVYNVGVVQLNGSTKAITCRCVNQMVGAIKVVHLSSDNQPLPSSAVTEDRTPSMIIGIDYFWAFIRKRIEGTYAGFQIIESTVGNLLSGFSSRPSSTPTVNTVSLSPCNDNLNEQISTWFELDQLGIRENPYENDDDTAWNLFLKTTTFKDGRFHVSLPLKDRDAHIPSNEGLALQQLVSLKNSLSKKKPEVMGKIDEIAHEWLTTSIIEEVPPDEIDNPKYGIKVYHPYHVVEKLSSATTKHRLVHNASAATQGNRSLNQMLYRGPVMLPSLLKLLLQFRQFKIVLTADVEKAFLQIGLNEPDRDLVRFMIPKNWLEPINKHNVHVYRFCRVNFGMISSPFLLAAVIKVHLMKTNSPLDQELMDSTYVDNVMLNADSIEEATSKMNEACARFAEIGMNLRDRLSSDKTLNAQWKASPASTKFLGLAWSPEEDNIHFSMPSMDGASTKRIMLQRISSVFDPLGLVAPATLPIRILIQTLWRTAKGWDDPISEDANQELKKITTDSSTVITLPRCTVFRKTPHDIHVFVDASQHAYAACVYLKPPASTEEPRLLCSKSRLAPLGGLTIPQMELLANLIGTRLASTIIDTAATTLTGTVYIWSDSSCVLSWIKNLDAEVSVFVQNRLNEIRKKQFSFRYVNTKVNPADLATRGCTMAQLSIHKIWWHGPPFLKLKENEWPNDLPETSSSPHDPPTIKPNDPTLVVESPTDVTFSPTVSITTTVNHPGPPPPLTEPSTTADATIDASRFSSFSKAVRTMLLVLLFLYNTTKKRLTNPKKPSHQAALRQLIKEAQRANLPSAADFKRLSLFYDDDGILRCAGRLQFSNLPPDAKDPVFLPRDNALTTLIIADFHERSMHASADHTIAQLRPWFHVSKLRRTVRSVLGRCQQCRTTKSHGFRLPPVPQLPSSRVNRAQPFEATGIDYAGPFNVRSTIGISKVWIALFTCLATRAIHLEVAQDLSSAEFLRCLRRFVSRKNLPKTIISDNGTNFVGAENIVKQWSTDADIRGYSSKNHIEWIFIPALSPWVGGVYERMIQIVKDALRRSIGRSLLDFAEFSTLVTETEAIVNSRPLTYCAEDNKILRPIDLIAPNAKINIPPSADLEDRDDAWTPHKVDLLDTWKDSTRRLNKLWHVWYTEYLTTLRNRSKVGLKQSRSAIIRSPRVNEVVLAEEPNLPRHQWRLAKIVTLFPNQDHEIRSVEIEMANGRRSRRSIALLHPLEVSESDQPSPSVSDQSSPSVSDQPPPSVSDQSSPSVSDQPSPAVSNSPASSIPKHKYNLRPRANRSTYFVIAAICLSLLSETTSAELLLGCEHRPTTLFQDACLSTGFIVQQEANSTKICWTEIDCGSRQLRWFDDPQIRQDVCGPPCTCSGTDGCSLDRQFTRHIPDMHSLHEALAPMIVPIHTSAHGDFTYPVNRSLYLIQLPDKSLAYVSQLDVIHKQITLNDSITCFGEGATTGNKAYCERFPCLEHATRFCAAPTLEDAFLQTPSGPIPIISWTFMFKTVYELPPPPKPTPSPCNVSLVCTSHGLRPLVNEPLRCDAQFYEICLLEGDHFSSCFSFDELIPDELLTPPKEYRLANHQARLRAWRYGHLVWEATTDCSGQSFCSLGSCILCLEIWYNPSCFHERLVQSTVGLTVFIVIAIVWKIVVVLCLHKGYRKCRRVRLTRRPLTTETTPPADDSRRWKRLPMTETIPLLPLAVFTLALLVTTEACSTSANFQAKKEECTVFRNGQVECAFQDTAVLTCRSGAEVCTTLKDHKNRPQGTITVNVQPVLTCTPVSTFITRLVDLKIVSSKRCPGMGSCNGNTCSLLKPSAKIIEFQPYNDFPGVTRCEEACSCITCGCLSCYGACLFHRIYAEPTADSEPIHVVKCAWQPSALISVRLETATAEDFFQFELAPGETAEKRNVSVALHSLSEGVRPIPNGLRQRHRRPLYWTNSNWPTPRCSPAKQKMLRSAPLMIAKFDATQRTTE